MARALTGYLHALGGRHRSAMFAFPLCSAGGSSGMVVRENVWWSWQLAATCCPFSHLTTHGPFLLSRGQFSLVQLCEHKDFKDEVSIGVGHSM